MGKVKFNDLLSRGNEYFFSSAHLVWIENLLVRNATAQASNALILLLTYYCMLLM